MNGGLLAGRGKPVAPYGVKITVIIFMVLLPAVLSIAAHAQQPAVVTAGPGVFYGSVDGYVLAGGSSSGIPGAKVWLINASRQNITYGIAGSDRNGHFYFLEVPPVCCGAYRVKAQSGNDTGISAPFGLGGMENKTINVSIRASPARVAIAAPRSFVVANGSDSLTLTALVMDSHGNPVGPDYPMTYTIKPSGNGTFAGSLGVPGPLQTVHNIATDNAGQAKISYGWVKPLYAGKSIAVSVYSDANPQVSSSIRVEARAPDNTPPSTTLSLSGMSDNAGGFISNVTAMLASSDNSGGWGVNATYYRLNGGSWTAYGGPFTISSDGANALEYYSTDRAGNAEKPHLRTVLIHRSA